MNGFGLLLESGSVYYNTSCISMFVYAIIKTTDYPLCTAIYISCI